MIFEKFQKERPGLLTDGMTLAVTIKAEIFRFTAEVIKRGDFQKHEYALALDGRMSVIESQNIQIGPGRNQGDDFVYIYGRHPTLQKLGPQRDARRIVLDFESVAARLESIQIGQTRESAGTRPIPDYGEDIIEGGTESIGQSDAQVGVRDGQVVRHGQGLSLNGVIELDLLRGEVARGTGDQQRAGITSTAISEAEIIGGQGSLIEDFQTGHAVGGPAGNAHYHPISRRGRIRRGGIDLGAGAGDSDY